MTLWMDETPPTDPSVLELLLIAIDKDGLCYVDDGNVGKVTDSRDPLLVGEGRSDGFYIRFSKTSLQEGLPLQLGEEVEVVYSFLQDGAPSMYHYLMQVDSFEETPLVIEYDLFHIPSKDYMYNLFHPSSESDK